MGITDVWQTIRQRLAGAPRQEEDERLLQLYWNRAELKKEFLRLQESNYTLLEKLRKQEGAEQRVKQQQEQLEEFLGNPDIGPQALVFYQLRALWRLGHKRIMRFAEQLRRQQEERERHQQLIEFDQDRRRRLAEVEKRLLDAQSYADSLEARVKLMQDKHAAMRGFWNYFRRRRLLADLAPLQLQWQAAVKDVMEVSEEQAGIEALPNPAFSGLSLEGKRLVNTAVIAYAQQLVKIMSAGGLAFLAKEATLKRVEDVHYGAREDCVRLMAQLKTALNFMAGEEWDLQALKLGTDDVRAHAQYRNDHDTVPLTDSIRTLPVSDTQSARMQSMGRDGANVLLDDYWDMYKALIS